MKKKMPETRALAPYLAPEIQVLELRLETTILSGLEGEPIDWDEEIEL